MSSSSPSLADIIDPLDIVTRGDVALSGPGYVYTFLNSIPYEKFGYKYFMVPPSSSRYVAQASLCYYASESQTAESAINVMGENIWYNVPLYYKNYLNIQLQVAGGGMAVRFAIFRFSKKNS